MKEKREIQMTGVSQVKIQGKWIVIIAVTTIVFFGVVGTMFVISAQSRPATVHTGGY